MEKVLKLQNFLVNNNGEIINIQNISLEIEKASTRNILIILKIFVRHISVKIEKLQKNVLKLKIFMENNTDKKVHIENISKLFKLLNRNFFYKMEDLHRMDF